MKLFVSKFFCSLCITSIIILGSPKASAMDRDYSDSAMQSTTGGIAGAIDYAGDDINDSDCQQSEAEAKAALARDTSIGAAFVRAFLQLIPEEHQHNINPTLINDLFQRCSNSIDMIIQSNTSDQVRKAINEYFCNTYVFESGILEYDYFFEALYSLPGYALELAIKKYVHSQRDLDKCFAITHQLANQLHEKLLDYFSIN